MTLRRFVPMWTLAVIATASAFVLHLALRSKSVALGYELGRARSEQAKLREVKRVLLLEAASFRTPERVEIVARTLLGMEQPPQERIISIERASMRPSEPDKTGLRESQAETVAKQTEP